MQIQITGHGTEITPALKEYVQKKITKLEEFFNNIQKTEVVLNATANANANLRQVVEIRAWLAGKKIIQVKQAGKDMYAAFDLTLDEAKHQVEKHKEKLGHEKIRDAKKLKQISRELPQEI